MKMGECFMNAPIRKTKIVCTMGPNLFEKHLIAPLMKAGMNVARFNFSHGTYETHQHYYDEVCRIRDELGLPVATMLDTKGPEIRVRSFKNGHVTLQNGQLFTLTTDEVEGDEERVSITYKELPQDIAVGSSILIDDGLIGMQVERIDGADIVCRVLNGGVVSNNKGVNIPNAHLSMPFISEKTIRIFSLPSRMVMISLRLRSRAARTILCRSVTSCRRITAIPSTLLPKLRTWRAWRTLTRFSAWWTA